MFKFIGLFVLFVSSPVSSQDIYYDFVKDTDGTVDSSFAFRINKAKEIFMDPTFEACDLHDGLVDGDFYYFSACDFLFSIPTNGTSDSLNWRIFETNFTFKGKKNLTFRGENIEVSVIESSSCLADRLLFFYSKTYGLIEFSYFKNNENDTAERYLLRGRYGLGAQIKPSGK